VLHINNLLTLRLDLNPQVRRPVLLHSFHMQPMTMCLDNFSLPRAARLCLFAVLLALQPARKLEMVALAGQGSSVRIKRTNAPQGRLFAPGTGLGAVERKVGALAAD
jgi:hypothetical protein